MPRLPHTGAAASSSSGSDVYHFSSLMTAINAVGRSECRCSPTGEETFKPFAPVDVGTRKGPMTGGWAAGSESDFGVLRWAFRMQAEWQRNRAFGKLTYTSSRLPIARQK